MAYAYTVKFPQDGIIGVYTTMTKAETAVSDWIRDQGYTHTVDSITKRKNYQTIWFDCGEYAEIDRWYMQ